MLIVPRFYHIHRRSGAKIVAASGHVEVKNCTKIYYFRRGSTPDPAVGGYSAAPDPYLLGRGLAAPPQVPHPASPFQPRLTICPPLEKILRAPMWPTKSRFLTVKATPNTVILSERGRSTPVELTACSSCQIWSPYVKRYERI